ncbi:hypothetical protein G4434_11955 [Coprococcus comes]|nr:hypothetical protein [Coprococcus comes]
MYRSRSNRRSGYSEKSVGRIGSQNLKKLEISEYIAEMLQKLQGKPGIV